MYCKNCGAALNENQAICLNCGVEAGKGKGHCPHCGNAVAEEAALCVKCGSWIKKETAPMKTNIPAGLKKRELVTAIILSLVTCGIYGIYWFVCLTNEMNALTGNNNDTDGVKAFLFTIITCGIYGYYWAYKMGLKRDKLESNFQLSASILYLILMLFGLGIVVYALMQDAINKTIDAN